MDLRDVDWDRVGGLTEVATLLDRKRSAVSNWFTAASDDTPEPLFTKAAGSFWDLAEWAAWGAANPAKVGPGFTGAIK